VLALLREWAEQRDFYWRANALRGLALRAPKLPKERAALAELFGRHQDDPAWLMRSHARLGIALLGDPAVFAIADDDPRVAPRLAMLALLQGIVPPLQPLFDALADERSFLGDPWGPRQAGEAHKALKNWLGEAHPLASGGTFPDAATGIAALRTACEQKAGQQLQAPTPRADGSAQLASGIELLSCKNGDQFVSWTADGHLHFGIDARPGPRLSGPTWERLSQQRTTLPLQQNLGVVICDSMRVRWAAPDVHIKIAPGALPPAATDWLKQLAAAIEEAGEQPLAARLRTGLEQFAAR
jgi:hypothetical protein